MPELDALERKVARLTKALFFTALMSVVGILGLVIVVLTLVMERQRHYNALEEIFDAIDFRIEQITDSR